jgi:hypothetical protein
MHRTSMFDVECSLFDVRFLSCFFPQVRRGCVFSAGLYDRSREFRLRSRGWEAPPTKKTV